MANAVELILRFRDAEAQRDLAQDRVRFLEHRVAELKDALEDCIGNLDAGYSATPKILRQAWAALKAVSS